MQRRAHIYAWLGRFWGRPGRTNVKKYTLFYAPHLFPQGVHAVLSRDAFLAVYDHLVRDFPEQAGHSLRCVVVPNVAKKIKGVSVIMSRPSLSTVTGMIGSGVTLNVQLLELRVGRTTRPITNR